MTYANINGAVYNVVETQIYKWTGGTPQPSVVDRINGTTPDDPAHENCTAQLPDGTNKTYQVCFVPFPIQLLDSREGVYNFTINTNTVYGAGNVPLAGVMSVIDVDVANLSKFLTGNYDSFMPTSETAYTAKNGHALRAGDITQANGWVVYLSDRRGDSDFDGDYDMEDVFGNNDGTLQPGEDVNGNNLLDARYGDEAVKYTGVGNFVSAPQAASVDHSINRRGARLINGRVLPGLYDSANSLNAKGFTFASENGVYVQGDYNAYGISSVGTPTPPSNYLPLNTSEHIPASVVADAVSILSNSWQDSNSFRSPFAVTGRVADETTVRFAMLTGDSLSSFNNSPNQGNSDPRLSGGVHNFKRFLENWDNVRLNYCGSLINLFNSHNSNGTYKNSGMVRNPPVRNWVFDTSFLEPSRLPPGTPFFQTIQLSGFQRID
jgi:hypothetical protein